MKGQSMKLFILLWLGVIICLYAQAYEDKPGSAYYYMPKTVTTGGYDFQTNEPITVETTVRDGTTQTTIYRPSGIKNCTTTGLLTDCE